MSPAGEPSAGSNCGGSQIRKVVGLSGERVVSTVGRAVSVASLSGVGEASGARVSAGTSDPVHAEQIKERRSSTRRYGFIGRSVSPQNEYIRYCELLKPS